VVNHARGWVYWYARRGGPQIWSGPLADEDLDAVALAYDEEVFCRAAKGTVARLVSDYRKSPEYGALAPSTRDLYGLFLDQISARLGAFSTVEFAGLKAREVIRDWRAEVSPRTADQVRAVIGALASWGRQSDILAHDCRPCADMPALYTAPPQHVWSREDIDKAMTLLPRHLSNVVALAINTGLRRGDLCAVTWAAVDRASGLLKWRTGKGAKHRRLALIPLTPALRMTLDRCTQADVGTILVNSYGQPWKPTGLASSMDAALARIGVNGTLHGLRRASATHLAGQGLTSRQIARQLGWSESEAEQMTAVYVDDEAAFTQSPWGASDA
jgi:integrase